MPMTLRTYGMYRWTIEQVDGERDLLSWPDDEIRRVILSEAFRRGLEVEIECADGRLTFNVLSEKGKPSLDSIQWKVTRP